MLSMRLDTELELSQLHKKAVHKAAMAMKAMLTTLLKIFDAYIFDNIKDVSK